MAAQAAAILRSKRKRLESNERETGSVADGEVYIQLANQLVQDSLKNPIPGGKKAKRRPLTNRPHVEKFEGSGSANVILYVGLGMVCIGLVITFVGIGDKGFQTLELKLIGPSLVGCGVFFALLRILFCTVPACFSGLFGCCSRKKDDKEKLLDVTQTNMNLSLNKTMNNRMRTIKHPVTGDRRVPKLSSKPAPVSDSDNDDQRQSQNRPRLKAARVVVRKTKDTEGHASDSSSSTFSEPEGAGGGVIISANKLQ